jgi:hypothetical protein
LPTGSDLTAVVFWGLNRYEDEINKRTSAENDFVTIKKVSEDYPGLREDRTVPHLTVSREVAKTSL